MQKYKTCLPDIEVVLPELAKLMGADYVPGDFSVAEDLFVKSSEDTAEWFLTGTSAISARVLLEKYEGYLFIEISGEGQKFNESKKYLYTRYLEFGGNPDAQEKP